MKTPRGFTLLELLVVIVIFSVFALLAYGGLDSVLNTRRQVEDALDRTATYQKAYMRLRNDFQQVSARTARDGYGDAQPALRTDLSSGSARVEFTRGGWRNPLLQPRPSLERVSYRLDQHKLLRESWRVLDQAQDSQPVSLAVLEDVDEAKWRFLDTQNNWHELWPDANTPEQKGPPLAVELVLSTKGLGDLRFLFRVGLDPVTIPVDGSPATGATPGTTPANTTKCDTKLVPGCDQKGDH
jgi:general secretion pathway protein J